MGRKPARPERLHKQDVRNTIITIIAIARHWARQEEDRSIGWATHTSIDADRAFLAKIVDLTERHENSRPLTYTRAGKKSVPTTKQHLQVAQLRKELAAVIRAARTGTVNGEDAVRQIALLVGLNSDARIKAWADETSALDAERRTHTPTRDAEGLLQRLSFEGASAGRIAQTLEAEQVARRAELKTERARLVLLPYVLGLFNVPKELHGPLTKAALAHVGMTEREKDEGANQPKLRSGRSSAGRPGPPKMPGRPEPTEAQKQRAEDVMRRIAKFFKSA